MKTKHTQGEWFINPRSSRNVRCGTKTIANCSQGQNGEAENEEIANAKLIAAAPDLLSACVSLIERCLRTADTTLMHQELYDAQQAIKKATP